MNIKNIFMSISIIFEVFFIIFFTIFIYLNQPIYLQSVIYIPKGSNLQIINRLNKSKVQFSKLDQYLLIFFGKAQSGWINISSAKLSRYEALKEFTSNKAALINITLIPGETSEYFLKNIVAKKLNLSYEKLLKELNTQSKYTNGVFIPQTYSIPLGINEKLFIQYLLAYANKHYEKIAKKIFGEYNEKKFYKFIIVASIIQKEAANKDEMPIIASVIYNRLNKNMYLQMDGMLNYGLNSHTKITAQMIREDNSEYNSYKNKNLPSVAICNTSDEAILAAIAPAKSEFLYFVRDKKTLKHKFSKTLSEHQQEINKQKLN